MFSYHFLSPLNQSAVWGPLYRNSFIYTFKQRLKNLIIMLLSLWVRVEVKQQRRHLTCLQQILKNRHFLVNSTLNTNIQVFLCKRVSLWPPLCQSLSASVSEEFVTSSIWTSTFTPHVLKNQTHWQETCHILQIQ